MKMIAEKQTINFRHLRALHAVAAEGSFSGAAESLGVVPSALSELMRQLEASVGAPLFDSSNVASSPSSWLVISIRYRALKPISKGSD